MSDLSFKYIPLTFISSNNEIQRQIRNTIVFSYLSNKYNDVREFSEILVSTQYGLNAAANELGNNKFLRISDIKEGVVDWERVPLCECSDEETYKLFKNDILVARTGGTTGKSFLINDVPDNAVFAGYLIRLRTKEHIKPSIVYEFLNSYAYWSQISELKMGSAQPNVNAQKLKTLKIPLAPVNILKEIEKLFSGEDYYLPELTLLLKSGEQGHKSCYELTNLFETQETLISKLRQSILQEAVQGKLTEKWRKENPNVEPAEKQLERIKAEKNQLIKDGKIRKEQPLQPITQDEIPYDLPDGWVWCRLGEIIKISSGNGLTSREMDKKGKIPVYGGNGITGYHSQNNISRRTIAIGRVGFYCGSIHLTEEKAWITDNAFITKFSEINIYREFLVWLLKGTNLKEDENATAQPVISGRKVYPIIVALPPLQEQKAIVEKVNSIMALCDELEQRVKESKEQIEKLMKVVLREVFDGK